MPSAGGSQLLMDRAVGFHGHGRLVEAEALYAQILVADPAHVQARHMLGVIRAQQERFVEAAQLIGAVVLAAPRDAVAWANHGNVLGSLGRHTEALESYNRAVALHPQNAQTWNNRGNALQTLGRLDEALESYDWALSAEPGLMMALNNRGIVLQKLNRHDAALAVYDQAIAHDPGNFLAHNGRGHVLQILKRHDAALEAFDRAVSLAPQYAPAWGNRALVLQNLGRLEAALASFRRAIALAPGLAQAHLNLGLCHLLMGNWAEGWPLYEWRKKLSPPVEAPPFTQPLWTGAEDIKDKTLLLYIEQGLGDTIQFFRFARLAQVRGARVVLAAQRPLLKLLSGADHPVTLIAGDDPQPPFDYHIPLASIPLAVGMGVGDIPAGTHYLRCEPERVAAWREKIGDTGFRIGIAWQGNESILGSEGKSFPVAALEEIAKLPDVRLIALQKNAGAEQLKSLPPGMRIEQYDFDTGPDAFLDTAAMMQVCDLVISADTAPVHLAGALGVPTWVALKYVPDWRWLLARDDSPWYPSLRLFRQAAPGDWGALFRAMRDELMAAVRKP